MKKTCHICGNPVDAPRKRIVDGKIVEQCVATVHDPHVIPISGAGEFLAKAKRSFRKAGLKRARG